MDFSMFQGDTRRLNFSLKRQDSSPLDVTGATLRWQASRLKAPGVFSSTPLLTKTETDGVAILDPYNGLVTVTISPADTINLSGNFYMELETTDASGDVATVFTGEFQIKKALIKPPL
jgi:hypothetical protein